MSEKEKLMEQSTIKSHNPATGEVLGEVEVSTKQNVTDAVSRAKKAFGNWSKTSFKERAAILLEAKNIILEESDEITDLIVSEVGKPRIEALTGEIFEIIECIEYYSKNSEKLLGAKTIKFPWYRGGIKSTLKFEPKGVVGIISPWNYPFYLMFNAIIQALITGNTVVIKPSEWAPLIAEKIKEILDETGLPKDVFTVVQGDGRVGQYLTESDVDKIVFTGSVATGKKIMATAAEKLHSVTLELGGSDPCIVLEDADIEIASSGVVWGRFLNAGQVCCAVKRVYVVESVAEEFIDKVVSKTGKIKVGNGLDSETEMGPLINKWQLETIIKQVNDATSKGAKILYGGKRLEELGGLFYAPTVLVDVNHEMKVMKEETFGPVLSIMTVKNREDAVRLANDSEFGLSGSIWTKDLKKGKELAEKLRVGTIWINNVIVMNPRIPWVGIKNSGLGQTGSFYGLLEFVNIKNIIITCQKKQDHWYPYSSSTLKYYKNAEKLVFSGKILEKFKSLLNMRKK
ncbi:Succinate-semialdehyde dehydrogenase (NAD(P)+) [groundwater metagenome]|uniref:Succinate-semialdehyde dehydrogenase (NAD(P)+) n=1 Tax=groundwater metagenome TaxID=717931 RepID=A0A098E6D7_9ZZZZ